MTSATPNYKGDKTNVMGVPMTCAKTRNAGDGVHVEYWLGHDDNNEQACAVRIVDTDEGALIGLTRFNGNDAPACAEDYYRKF